MTDVGKIRVAVVASEYISPKKPLRFAAKVPRAKVKKLEYILDKKVVGRPTRAPYALKVTPKQLASGPKHKVALRVTPKKGRPHRMTIKITTAPCVHVLSAFQWKTTKGTGLRLRIDSRRALGSAKFTVPSAMLPSLKDKGTVGRVRLVLGSGAKVPFKLRLATGSKTLLKPAANTPKVVLGRKGVTVTGLPKRVGILELTLLTKNSTSPKALLRKGKKAALAATVVENGRSARLKTVIRAQRH